MTTQPPQIESGIPIPTSMHGRPLTYPFQDIEVGQSMWVEGTGPLSVGSRMVTAARAYGNRHNMKFCVRTIDGGHRIWRIA
jgi:hypothetical protein